MNKLFFYFLLTTLTINVCYSQCIDADKIVFGGNFDRPLTYNSRTDKSIKFKNQEKENLYHYPINVIEGYTKKVFKKSNEYIISRAGKDFFNKVSLYDLTVIYHDSKSMVDFDSLKFEINKFKEISYSIKYNFTPDSLVTYRFTIEFDSNWKMVSSHKIPDINLSKNAAKVVPLCKAIKNAKSHEDFKTKEIERIKLVYLTSENTFEYLVTEYYNTSQLNNGQKYETLLLHINATNGKVSSVSKEEWTIDEMMFD